MAQQYGVIPTIWCHPERRRPVFGRRSRGTPTSRSIFDSIGVLRLRFVRCANEPPLRMTRVWGRSRGPAKLISRQHHYLPCQVPQVSRLSRPGWDVLHNSRPRSNLRENSGVCSVLLRIRAHHGRAGVWRRRNRGRIRRIAGNLIPPQFGISVAVADLAQCLRAPAVCAGGPRRIRPVGQCILVQLELHAVAHGL
jgi:hypothetical protein